MAAKADILMIHDDSRNVEVTCLNERGYQALGERCPQTMNLYVAGDKEREWKLEGIRVDHVFWEKA